MHIFVPCYMPHPNSHIIPLLSSYQHFFALSYCLLSASVKNIDINEYISLIFTADAQTIFNLTCLFEIVYKKANEVIGNGFKYLLQQIIYIGFKLWMH